MSCTYLAHHELESVMIIVIVIIFIFDMQSFISYFSCTQFHHMPDCRCCSCKPRPVPDQARCTCLHQSRASLHCHICSSCFGTCCDHSRCQSSCGHNQPCCECPMVCGGWLEGSNGSHDCTMFCDECPEGSGFIDCFCFLL